MLGITSFPFFVVAVLLLNITPGPDTAFIVGRSVSQGRKAGIVSALGISAGCIVHTLAVSFGLTAILAASAAAFTVIKIAGAIYLIYLGVRLLLAHKTAPAANAGARIAATQAEHAAKHDPGAPAPAPSSTTAEIKPARPLRSIFVSGFWTNVLNPKVILFFVSFFPQFVSTASPHKTLAFLALGAVFVLMSTVWNGGVAWVAGSVTERMRGRPAVRRWIDRVVGTAFIGLGMRLAALHR
ncbi:LysE family translocator [Pararobbsia silviterrae]|uniref:LysE family translocator n=1 Tax=Pararobbsia silviterrae TaxID=1792498 RepID=A0A494YA48_9BURK|nr:LysE family translocator [Pararobbsia silviterrae]RKP58600.1 LysE family translocator [Pararobbsia silviterrae]